MRIVLISSFFYLAVKANLIAKDTKSVNYTYQPLEVIIDSVVKVRDEPKNSNKDRANAVRLYTLLTELFDTLYSTRVECLIARDWQLGGGEREDFRTTWSAGWWLDQLVELYHEA